MVAEALALAAHDNTVYAGRLVFRSFNLLMFDHYAIVQYNICLSARAKHKFFR